MRPTIALALGIAFAWPVVAPAAHAAGTVHVSYAQVETFIDAGNRRNEVEDTLKQLTRHFEVLASRHLADGQALTIEVLDIDLAGEIRPSRRTAQDVRLLKGQADWPRIKLRYTLASPGQAPRTSEQWVADMDYLHGVVGRYAGESLAYEKRMLADWFRAEFGMAGSKQGVN